MKKIDINCDMGESFYDKRVGDDKNMMPYITSCNVACGFHGGDPSTIKQTIETALKNNVLVGAHPSFYDIEGFGRRKMNISSEDLEVALIYQISSVKGIAESLGTKIHHVKAHGALYNMASQSDHIAKTIVEAVKKVDSNLKIYGPSGMRWKDIAESSEITYVSEIFSDRNYNDNLTLVDRKNENAMITDSVKSLEHVRLMIDEGKVLTVNGNLINIEAETVCIHGDQPNALEFAKKIYSYLKSRISK